MCNTVSKTISQAAARLPAITLMTEIPRIRPQTSAEVLEGCGICARAGDAAGEGGVALGSERAFTFDYAFEPLVGQQEIYDTCVRKLVESALDGYNATVLAYGQVGSFSFFIVPFLTYIFITIN
ncbi:unnamed protein product [Pieris macdunnoughi]|uniref:Kinesin motor domain-containing protein n=1 Tax=Pieris macdunnoughi TaxID=345717 RepID=A0A821TGB5_9NEOP|nr:unnamed protein product [Pieris macdunnoughi]